MSDVSRTPVLDTAEDDLAGDGLRVEELGSWNALDAIRPEWEYLLADCKHATIFATPEWLGPWWQAFAADRRPLAVAVRDGVGRLRCLATFMAEESGPLRRLRLMGDGSGDSDNLDILVDADHADGCVSTFLSWWERQTRFAVCALNTLPENSIFGARLIAQLQARCWPYIASHTRGNCISLPATWEQYVNLLDPQFRPLLTRYPKRLQNRHRVRVVRCEHQEQLASCLEVLFDLHQRRWVDAGESGAFADSRRRAFYLFLAPELLKRGWLDFWLLEVDDALVAAQFCFHYRDTVFLLQEGFDPRLVAEKIGYALRAEMLKAVISAGFAKYDFLGGDDPHKEKFAALPTAYLNLEFARPRHLGHCYIRYQQELARTKSWLKDNLPARIVNSLRNIRR